MNRTQIRFSSQFDIIRKMMNQTNKITVQNTNKIIIYIIKITIKTVRIKHHKLQTPQCKQYQTINTIPPSPWLSLSLQLYTLTPFPSSVYIYIYVCENINRNLYPLYRKKRRNNHNNREIRDKLITTRVELEMLTLF